MCTWFSFIISFREVADMYQEVVRKYRELDRDIALLYYRISSRKQFEETFFVPDADTVSQTEDEIASLRKRLQELPVTDAVNRIWHGHFAVVLNDISDRISYMKKDPSEMFSSEGWTLSYFVRLDQRSCSRRAELIEGRLKQLGRAAEYAAGQVSAQQADSLSGALHRLAADIELVSGELSDYFTDEREELDAAFGSAAELLKRTADSLTVSAGKRETARPDKERYAEILRTHYGVDINELRQMCERDIEESRSRVLELAAHLPVKEKPADMKETAEVLNRYAGAAESPEEMFARENEYLKRCRKAAHENVKLPDDEICFCRPIAHIAGITYPWGGYEGGDDQCVPVRGQMFLNQFNFRAVTDGWMKINALHECYPGHHVQYVRTLTDRTPETIKIDGNNIPLIEGTAIRSETAFMDVYADDPFYPLFAAYRRHHAAVRIRADLMLFEEQCEEEEAVRLYEEELGFDRGTAAGQVASQLVMPGYFTCYHYGLKKIEEWEKKYGYDRKTYTELLFSAGYISISAFHDYLQLSEEDKYRYSHDYPSMLRDFSRMPEVN